VSLSGVFLCAALQPAYISKIIGMMVTVLYPGARNPLHGYTIGGYQASELNRRHTATVVKEKMKGVNISTVHL
jgi:hypothetical protein